MIDSPHEAIPTSEYSYEDLADIYNRAREDYIVPMPMNAKRMKEYVTSYDVDLASSFVAIDKEDGDFNGVCMLGIRGDRTWITRLGVIPVRRRRHSGLFLMEAEIAESRRLGKAQVILEVIKGNDPAHRLFSKLGFQVTRELLVIRRPPARIDEHLIPDMNIEPFNGDDVFTVLENREAGAAWTEQTASLRNAGRMEGLQVTLPDGQTGWIVFQKTSFQLSHFVLQPDISRELMLALITAVHVTYNMQDTKIENVPLLHPTWDVFQELGYFVAFGRIEMILDL
ncbi:MAG: GNAT family N-acetyltransferase [Phototrophicaceae bacterium]